MLTNPDSKEGRQLVALIHTIDHMQRLHERCDEDLERAIIASHRSELVDAKQVLDEHIDTIIDAVEARRSELAAEIAPLTHARTREMETAGRDRIYQSVARDLLNVRYATECAEALRWLTRVSRHISRICHYLNQGMPESGKP